MPRFASPFVREVFVGIYFIICNSQKASDGNSFSYEKWEKFLESGLLVRKGNRFFFSEPNGMELSNQILVSMFRWWDEIN